MKILFNPTNNKVKVNYKGEELEIEPQSSSQPLSDEQINYWIKIHSFLVVKELGGSENAKPFEEVKLDIHSEEVKSDVIDIPKEKINGKVVIKNKKSSKKVK